VKQGRSTTSLKARLTTKGPSHRNKARERKKREEGATAQGNHSKREGRRASWGEPRGKNKNLASSKKGNTYIERLKNNTDKKRDRGNSKGSSNQVCGVRPLPTKKRGGGIPTWGKRGRGGLQPRLGGSSPSAEELQ